MIFRNSALLLLTVFVTGASGQDGACPLDAQVTGADCSQYNLSCDYDKEPNGDTPACGVWQCRCNEGSFTCSARGDGCKDNEETDVEEMDVGVDESAKDASSGVVIPVGVVSSLVASGALVATVFGL